MCSGTSSKTLNIDELKAGKAGSKLTGPLFFSCLFIYYYYFYGDWQPALKDNQEIWKMLVYVVPDKYLGTIITCLDNLN